MFKQTQHQKLTLRILLTGLAPALAGLLAAAEPPPWVAPAAASGEKNPVTSEPASIARGKAIYQAVCFACHGQTGKGDGPAGVALTVHPGDLTSDKVQNQSDGALLWKLSTGRAPMPPFAAAYPKEDLWKLVTYIRTLSSGEAPAPTPVATTNPAPKILANPPLGTLDDLGAGSIPGTVADAGSSELSDLIPALPGRTGFLISGYATADFQNIEGGNSTFGAKFAPILLVKQGDNLLFEGELEFELEDAETEANLEYAQILWLANDYLTIGAGKFLNPMNYYAERVHPDWINKLPAAPLPFGHDDSILAGTQLGVQARGGIPVGDARIGYAVYLSNGPSLVIEEEEEDGHEEPVEGGEEDGHALRNGSLDFNNFGDRNDNLAVGGRLGISPLPGFEVGYGIEFAEVTPSGSPLEDINALSQSVDVSYVHSSDRLRGVIDARAQFVWVEIDNPGEHPLEFENNSSGGYVQLAYRPSKADNEFIRNLEGVCRYDWLDLPGEYPDARRMTFGLNYWLNSSTVIKAAVEFGEEDSDHGTEDYTGFRLQAAMGF